MDELRNVKSNKIIKIEDQLKSISKASDPLLLSVLDKCKNCNKYIRKSNTRKSINQGIF